MVTKCDLVDGFAEYFDDLTAEARAQVWGVTFPYEQTLANESPQPLPAEFDALMTRLNERVFDRLEDVRDARRRTKVFAFPQQMATLRDALTQWVMDVFGAREFDGQILLRGVYFTSGTQEGTPIDRLLGSIGRTFGADEALLTPRGPGKAYFVEHLLKHVMIGESGLAGINRRLELRNASLQLGVYVVAGLLAAAGVAALSVSYARNRDFLDQVGGAIGGLRTDGASGAEVAAQRDCRAPRRDSRRRRPRGPVSRDDVDADALGTLRGAIDRQLGARCVRARARQHPAPAFRDAASGPGDRIRRRSPEAVRLLQGLPDARGPVASGQGVPRRRSSIGSGSRAVATPPRPGPRLRSTSRRCSRMQRRCGRCRSTERWSARRAAACRGRSIPRILYDGIKRGYADEAGQGLRVDQLAGLEVERVFRRKSGVPLSAPMPRCTRASSSGSITTEGRAEILKVLTRDAWIWGESNRVVARQRQERCRRKLPISTRPTTSARGTRSSTTCSSSRSPQSRRPTTRSGS